MRKNKDKAKRNKNVAYTANVKKLKISKRKARKFNNKTINARTAKHNVSILSTKQKEKIERTKEKVELFKDTGIDDTPNPYLEAHKKGFKDTFGHENLAKGKQQTLNVLNELYLRNKISAETFKQNKAFLKELSYYDTSISYLNWKSIADNASLEGMRKALWAYAASGWLPNSVLMEFEIMYKDRDDKGYIHDLLTNIWEAYTIKDEEFDNMVNQISEVFDMYKDINRNKIFNTDVSEHVSEVYNDMQKRGMNVSLDRTYRTALDVLIHQDVDFKGW